ncbi:MAG: ABC transporter ATP-binding protein [Granulosicoccus sp.]|nr:ABC transporter ATP-binding protein [Granulosicoccus sp.]
MSSNPAVEFTAVSRHFDDVKAVDSVDLSIEQGEFFTLLGPSGSGKTTCLRLIAGFDRPTEGQLRLFGKDVQNVPPYRREVNTVFQDYALFPHMTVLDNVAYPLMVRDVKKQERYDLAEDALGMVQLAGYGLRKPSELSGGQRQRVALARALINRPKLLLLDEPLGALDLKLREEMQEELKTLQQSLGITFIFVTHDQSEALSMSDRIAIFNQGRVVQTGSPEQVYHRPDNTFVANFIGSSNVISPQDFLPLAQIDTTASLRPEAIKVVEHGGHEAVVRSKSFLGASVKLVLDINGVSLIALVDHAQSQIQPGDSIRVDWSPADLHLMETSDA